MRTEVNEIRAAMAKKMAACAIIIENEKNISYGVQWKVVRGENTATVNTYHGKKGFRCVVQSRDAAFQAELERLAAEAAGAQPPLRPVSRPQTSALPAEDVPLIGCDESGKGDILGPLCVAAVYLDAAAAAEWRARGVRDSKELDDEKICRLAAEFQAERPEDYALRVLLPAEYNDLYEKYRAEKKNLNHLLTDLHFANMERLLTREAAAVVLDRFAAESLMADRFATADITLPLVQIPRGERYTAVALASILARAAFVAALQKLGDRYGETIPKGASSATARWVAQFAATHGAAALRDIGKWHFKTFDPYR